MVSPATRAANRRAARAGVNIGANGTTTSVRRAWKGRRSVRVVAFASRGGSFYNPAVSIGLAITQSLDPLRAPGKVRTMADMTPDEIAALTPPRGRR